MLALIPLLMINIGVVYAVAYANNNYFALIDTDNNGEMNIAYNLYHDYNDDKNNYILTYDNKNGILNITNKETNDKEISVVISTFPFTNQSNWVAGPYTVKPGETLQLVFKDDNWVNPNDNTDENTKAPIPLLSIILALITIPIIALRERNWRQLKK